MSETIKQIIKAFSENEHTSGCESVFISSIGLKLFSSKDARDTAYYVQDELSKHKLAPKVLSLYNELKKLGIYGFFTEVVKVHTDKTLKEGYLKKATDKLNKQSVKLLYCFKNHLVADNAPYNMGYSKKNKCMFIDTGMHFKTNSWQIQEKLRELRV